MRALLLPRLVMGANVLAGCSGGHERPVADTAAAVTQPDAVALADLAGTWQLRSISEAGDSTIAVYDLIATADPADWTFRIPSRGPIPVRVTAAGDSILGKRAGERR